MFFDCLVKSEPPMEHLEKKTEEKMVSFFNSLSEKDRRRYAAIESIKLGRGGLTYISELFECDYKTIAKGLLELDDEEAMRMERIRIEGGGRTSKLKLIENINETFLEIIKEHTAGDPMNADIKWTNLSKAKIGILMAKKGIKISRNIIKKLLKKNKFVKRQMQRSESIGKNKNRNDQFEKINQARSQYENSNNPIISIDSKKTEKIGNLYRDGKLQGVEVITVYDHDFPHLAVGKIIPYTIYDMKNNEAFVYIGTSTDTSELACDAIKAWWNQIGKNRYPNATSILCLADGGGSNSASSDLFKSDLENLANAIMLDIRMAHYPPYTSKHNPIEHRVFPHITRAMSGVVLLSINLAKELIKTTTTATGLKVFVRVSKKIYEKGRKVADDFHQYAKIIYDDVLEKWNYMVLHDA